MSTSSGFFRHTTLLFLLLAAGISMVLFSVKYQVHQLEDTHKRLVVELAEEKRAVHVLKAEWETLNDPVRIQELAIEHLAMGPIAPKTVVGMDAVLQLPLREFSFGEDDTREDELREKGGSHE